VPEGSAATWNGAKTSSRTSMTEAPGVCPSSHGTCGGALGEDAGNLIFDALFDFFVPAEQIAALAEAVSGGYVEGLEASSWRGDTGAVLRALHAAAAVKYFWILPAMLEAAAGGKATLNRAPIEECFAQWAPAVPELVGFARRV
jgi:hypothetical protein